MSFTWPPGSTTHWTHGWPGQGLRPRGLSLGHALGGIACTVPLALVRLHVTCRLWDPSPQDTEHSDHGLVTHLRTKNYRRLVRTGCQASAGLQGGPAKETPIPMLFGGPSRAPLRRAGGADDAQPCPQTSVHSGEQQSRHTEATNTGVSGEPSARAVTRAAPTGHRARAE